MEHSSSSIRRCAIYTRKSSEEGLEQDFNSLHAQREACEAFIRSQAGEGWRLIKTAYDDGGLSGGTMERPGLQRLLADIGGRLVDVVVVYKVDRLTRSLADFAKMVEVFDAHCVSFVAVTQQFNTTTSMGRLTLNVLLSFAQFEREVTGERIRDKIAASKKKGIWMGGNVPLGYDWCDRRLVINQAEAETVRHIFARYLELRSVRLLQDELASAGIVSKVRVCRKGGRSGGKPFGRGALYELLANPIYLGEIRHKQLRHPGQHQAIIDRARWEEAQRQLKSRASRARGRSAPLRPGPLAGRLFDEQRQPLYVSATFKGARRYRYYVSRNLTRGAAPERGWRLAAKELERAVALAARQMLMERPPLSEILLQAGASAAELKSALEAADARTKQLEHPSESAIAIDELVERVDLRKDGIEVTLDLGGLLDQPCRFPVKMTRSMPLAMKRRGVELRLVVEGVPGPPRPPDPALLKAIARGRRWFTELATGKATFTKQIAQREGVNDSYIRRLIPLAFLAPEIVETIVQGKQPLELSAEHLKRRLNLPFDWDSQKLALLQ